MESLENKGIVIIGGGPAGYVAAIRAAQLGGRVTLVEADKLGGTCLNRGCIPTKFMLRSVETYQSVSLAGRYGVNTSAVNFDIPQMQKGKGQVISALSAGVKGLLAGNKVMVINGRARFISPKKLEVDSGQETKQIIEADNFIIATGAKPIKLPIPGADSPDILDVDDLLEMQEIPESIVIIGGGVIGVEMATVLAKSGCKVSVVEMLPHCLPTQDDDIASILEGVLKKDGISIYTNSRVSRIEANGAGKKVIISQGDTETAVEAAAVAIAVGYKPNIDDLGLEECGVTVNKGHIQVNQKMQTNVPGIYAAGDVVGGMMLAYVAIAEGTTAAENALGENSEIDYNAIPQCIFTIPEVASVGLTEREAVAQGYSIDIGKFPFAANGMAMIMGEKTGIVKIIAEQGDGKILGVHIIGPQATTLISEAATAMKLNAGVDDIIAMIHSHPSLTEAIWEAAADIRGKAIHMLPRKQ